MKLTVVICTHNREALLERTLASLDAALRPAECRVEILVVANACSDGTAALLDTHSKAETDGKRLPLRWVEEPTPGKSYALNRAIPLIEGDLVAFVDDDHRVDAGYLTGISRAAATYPAVTIFCGRIVPDWDGSEPAWVHDSGPYRIYPLPVPRSEYGDEPRRLTPESVLPGGGNLFLRRAVFDRVGSFSVRLGPHGHDLGGGEDSDFVARCLEAGETLHYTPWVTQYHYVDPERLRLGYLLRKSFQRSRYGIRTQPGLSSTVPAYMWRKLATYMARGAVSTSWSRARFYLVRIAAALGELTGFLDRARERRRATGRPKRPSAWTASSALALLLAGALALIGSTRQAEDSIEAVLLVALLFTSALALKSFYDFSQTGPPLRREILRNYRGYSLLALLRLTAAAFVLLSIMAWLGVAVYAAVSILSSAQFRLEPAIAAAVLGVLTITSFQFCKHLLAIPASITASSHYRVSRLYPIWWLLTPRRLRAVQWMGSAGAITLFTACAWLLVSRGEPMPGAGFALLALLGPLAALAPSGDRAPATAANKPSGRPNILMIGSDTLRADRVGGAGYARELTPFINALAARGTQFTACYVPCARTAPSLLSLLSGTWPYHHGIRDNFVGDDETHLPVSGLASAFARHGYRTAAVSDWSGGDFGKFPLGFEILEVPKDQWNIKYLIRQGPKDLRLFLSLFTHNAFGKWLLPELYYLAGVPLTSLVGHDARALISRFAERGESFLLNVFVSTTHPPFGSEYPYYTLWSDRSYAGESKFAMAKLTDPWEIIRRQADTKKDFDLDQVIDLYDGCVMNFDDEVKRIVGHVEACGLRDNTIVVIYSDHGMEFFEHDTWGQGNSVRGDHSARVPLIIVDPRIRVSRKCPCVVRSIDVAPTLLELAGVAPEGKMDGVSLVPQLRGELDDQELVAFNETGIWLTELPGMPTDHLRYPDLLELLEVPNRRSGTLAIKPQYRKIVVEAKDRMVRRGAWKLTYQPTTNAPRYALFNLTADPECKNDVAEAHPQILRDLKELLMQWVAGRKRPAARGRAMQEYSRSDTDG